MNTIEAGKGWVEINGQPFQKGEHLRLTQWGGYEEIEIKDRITGDTVLQRTPYGQMSTGGAAFLGSDALKSYIHENFFFLTRQTMIRLALVAFLQGAFNTTTGAMRSTLAQQNVLPADSAFAYPSDAEYPGGTSRSLYPSIMHSTLANINTATFGGLRVVDWVLVEVRSQYQPQDVITAHTALLLTNGTIVDVDGDPVKINVAPSHYFIAVRHRNHLSICTAQEQALSATPFPFDFTSALVNSMDNGTGNALVQVSPGKWAMRSGDIDRNGMINNIDVELAEEGSNNGLYGYENADVSLDSVCDTTDESLTSGNAASSIQAAAIFL